MSEVSLISNPILLHSRSRLTLPVLLFIRLRPKLGVMFFSNVFMHFPSNEIHLFHNDSLQQIRAPISVTNDKFEETMDTYRGAILTWSSIYRV